MKIRHLTALGDVGLAGSTKRIRKPAISALQVAALAATMISWGTAQGQSSQPASPAPVLPAWPIQAPPLTVNPEPMRYDAGPLGKVYVQGVATAFGQWQNNVPPGDFDTQADISNGQIFFNKTEGLVQYFVQVGAYSIPDLGLPYFRSRTATNAFFGPVPQGFLKIAPTRNFSFAVGKLPTLIGAETTFSPQNMNIQRGLLWNQENAVNRGVQVNYTAGPVALSASWNDGFYSNRYTWAWLSATWSINSKNILAFIGSGNTKPGTNVSTLATPLYQNNEQLYNLIYIRTAGQWTIQPYLQFTHVPRMPELGAARAANTYGAALLANYKFAQGSKVGGLKLDRISLPFRVEYIASTGTLAEGAPNLMYGPGSKAWSVTVTPTYQRNIFFARPEFSVARAMNTTPGMAFGPAGTDTTQVRVLLEVGVMF